MENNERILAKADVRKVPSKVSRFFAVYFPLIVAVLLIVGLTGSIIRFGSPQDGSKEVIYVSWCGVPLYDNNAYRYSIGSYHVYGPVTYAGNIVWVSAMFIVLFATPFCINAIYKRQCKNTELYVSESYVYGLYSGFLSKKSLKMPIEKVDNLTNASTFKDKLRSGTTIGVCSASGIIRFHFVQNAEEVITAAMNRINELKTAPKAAPASSASTSDKLKELLSLKESGLITEEEFAAKKNELLAKM